MRSSLPLVVFSHLRWDFVYQRPQHLLSRLAMTRPVLFIEEPMPCEGEAHWTRSHPAPGVEVLRPHTPVEGSPGFSPAQMPHLLGLVDSLLETEALTGCDAWLYTPLALPLAERLTPDVLVFDAMDELALFAHAPAELAEREAATLARADVVFCGGPSLYARRKDRHDHVFCFSSSVDAAHFASAAATDVAALRAGDGIPDGPRLGYMGVVDERLDPALLAAAADADPSWQIVVAGPVVKIDPASLPQRANLHYLGGQAYEALPALIASWDVCLMPFALNEATRFISPTKTLEYFAVERPVVSTSVADVAGPYGPGGPEGEIVYLGDGPEAFVAACRAALTADAAEREARTAAMRRVLAATSWDRTAAAMRAEIEAARARRHATGDGSAVLDAPVLTPGAAPVDASGDGARTTTERPQLSVPSAPDAAVENRNEPAPRDVAQPTGYSARAHADGLNSDSLHAGNLYVGDGAEGLDGASGDGSSGDGHASSARRVASSPFFDYLIVGAGFAGAVLAERLASQAGKRVLIVDRRHHIGGNAYDTHNADGLLVHPYGPHIFHTNSARVFDYLSGFTAWRPYEHRVLASVEGQLVPIPINLDTVNRLYGLSLSAFELDAFFAEHAEPVERVRTSEDVVVSKVGRDLYNKLFRGYTRKQWDLDPSELDASVTARVPTRTNRDDRYFTDTFQAMPRDGYTRMFEAMLNHPRISVMTGTDYRDVARVIPHGGLIFTGPVDEYFGHRFGALPYRSLRFDHQTHTREQFQSVGTVNFPNDHAYTRVTEFKHLTGQEHPTRTAVVYEYPSAEGDPYYPIPRAENAELYRKYAALAADTPGVHFVGRLATYKYYNMDQVVAQALTTFDKIMGRKSSDSAADAPATGAAPAGADSAPALTEARLDARRQAGVSVALDSKP